MSLLKQSYVINTILMVVSFLFSGYLIEWALEGNINFFEDQVKLIQRRNEVKIDTRSVQEVIAEYESLGVDVVPNFGVPLGYLTLPNKQPFLPLSGVANKLTITCVNRTGKYGTITSDEKGFNNPLGMWNKDGISVVLIGDSFAYGSCVASDETIAAQLRKRGIPTLSVAMGGTGAFYAMAVLSEYVSRIKPKKVIWIYYEGNDLIDIEKEKKSAAYNNYLSDDYSQNLFDRQDLNDKSIRMYFKQWITKVAMVKQRRQDIKKQRKKKLSEKKELESSVFMQAFLFVKMWSLRHKISLILNTLKKEPEKFKNNDNIFKVVATKIKTRVENWGGELLFVYLPSINRYVGKITPLPYYRKDAILKIIDDLSIPVIDIEKQLQRYQDPLTLYPFRRFQHFNDKGYKLVADGIFSTLTKQPPAGKR